MIRCLAPKEQICRRELGLVWPKALVRVILQEGVVEVALHTASKIVQPWHDSSYWFRAASRQRDHDDAESHCALTRSELQGQESVERSLRNILQCLELSACNYS